MRVLERLIHMLRGNEEIAVPPEPDGHDGPSDDEVRGLWMKEGRARAVLETARAEKRAQQFVEENRRVYRNHQSL